MFFRRRERVVAPIEAARRAVCMHVVVERARLESVMLRIREEAPAEFEEHRRSLHVDAESGYGMLADLGVAKALTKRERAVLQKPFATWTLQEAIDASWNVESLGVAFWALGVIPELPPYDTQFGHGDDDFPTSAVEKLKWPPTLRPADEIHRARDIAELWHWRARTYEIQRDPVRYPPPPGFTFPQIISMAADKAEREGEFKSIGGDFPAFGKPYRQVNEEQWHSLTSVALERHRMLNWLCRYARDWDKVPTDT